MPSLDHTAFINACRDERGVGHHTLRAYAQDYTITQDRPQLVRSLGTTIIRPATALAVLPVFRCVYAVEPDHLRTDPEGVTILNQSGAGNLKR